MGAKVSLLNREGQLRLYDHPYSFTQKLKQFPYKHYFDNSLFVRCCLLGILATTPIFMTIQKTVNTKENKQMWKDIRAARNSHTHFDPPKPVEFPKQPEHWF